MPFHKSQRCSRPTMVATAILLSLLPFASSFVTNQHSNRCPLIQIPQLGPCQSKAPHVNNRRAFLFLKRPSFLRMTSTGDFVSADDMGALQTLFNKYCDKEGLMTKTSVLQITSISELIVSTILGSAPACSLAHDDQYCSRITPRQCRTKQFLRGYTVFFFAVSSLMAVFSP